MSNRVSVVIPCYNQARFLPEAIESALNQSISPHEIIVVDDGSTDDTSDVAADFKQARLIRQENRGLSAARNRGLAECSGDFIIFLDADDRLLPPAVEAGLDAFAERPECAFVFGHYSQIASDGSALPPPGQPCALREHYRELLKINYIGMHATVMYRRETLKAFGAFDVRRRACEDYDLYLRVSRVRPVRCHHKTVAEYRQHQAGLSRNNGLMLRAAITVLRSQWKHVKGDRELVEAYEEGMAFWRQLYGQPLVASFVSNLNARRWRACVREAILLLRYYPDGLLRPARRRLMFQSSARG